jgi:beta-lactamase superfamily II metal-dependent hydrolase
MLRIEMLNAGHGDALLIEYGDDSETHRILVDGGPYRSYDEPGGLLQRLQQLDDDEKTFELLVMTHIDTDHIDGVIKLLQEKALGLTFKDIWFNGWKHVNLAVEGKLGGKQGEFLGALLESEGLPWNANKAWEPTLGAVVVPEQGDLPVASLAGDATATLLSPGPDELKKLKKDWIAAVKTADFDAGDTRAALDKLKERADLRPKISEGTLGAKKDTSAANQSSIAFVFQYDDERLLLTGDAFASVLERGTERYATEHGTLDVAAFKLPHHGSWSNLSPDLLAGVKTNKYLVSTNGKHYDHPDADAIELILLHGGDQPHLVFNYDQPFTEHWLEPSNQRARGYTASRSNTLAVTT